MPYYKYKALDYKGRTIIDKIIAANDIELEQKLKSMGLDLFDYSITKESSGFFTDKSVSRKDIIVLCIQLEQMERSAVPLLEAIGDLRDNSDNHGMKSILATIYDNLSNGTGLSDALRDFPDIFDEVFVGLVKAGEKTGNLADVFHHIANHLKWLDNINGTIKKATYYPVFLLVIMCVVIGVMMTFVIPQLSRFLIAQGFELPIHTKALISTSEFFINHYISIFSIPILAYFGIKIGSKISENFAFTIDMIILMIPKIGITIRKIEVARFCRFMGITYRSGIGILECLDISQNVVVNMVIKDSISTIKKNISDGMSLTNAIQSTNQFPPMVVRMMRIGETSGRLDETLANVNYFYDREVDDSVSQMIGVIQPTLTIVMGAVMLWISLAVFGPLYSSFSKLNF